MVKIHYCPKCAKASREHLFKKIVCNVCRTQYEVIEVSRSRYFIVQFVFLMMGFIILIAAFIFTNPFERVYEFLGVSIIGISMWLFTLYFQLLDSKDMEYRAEQQAGGDKYDTDEPKVISTRTMEAKPDRIRPGMPDRRLGLPGRPESRPGKEPPPILAKRVRRALPSRDLEEEPATGARSKPAGIKDMATLLREAEEAEEK